jgi:hypothetical protein
MFLNTQQDLAFRATCSSPWTRIRGGTRERSFLFSQLRRLSDVWKDPGGCEQRRWVWDHSHLPECWGAHRVGCFGFQYPHSDSDIGEVHQPQHHLGGKLRIQFHWGSGCSHATTYLVWTVRCKHWAGAQPRLVFDRRSGSHRWIRAVYPRWRAVGVQHRHRR